MLPTCLQQEAQRTHGPEACGLVVGFHEVRRHDSLSCLCRTCVILGQGWRGGLAIWLVMFVVGMGCTEVVRRDEAQKSGQQLVPGWGAHL